MPGLPSMHIILRPPVYLDYHARMQVLRDDVLDTMRELLYRDCVDRESLAALVVPTWKCIIPTKQHLGEARLLHKEMLEHQDGAMSTDEMARRFAGTFQVYDMLPPLVNRGLALPVGTDRYRAIPGEIS